MIIVTLYITSIDISYRLKQRGVPTVQKSEGGDGQSTFVVEFEKAYANEDFDAVLDLFISKLNDVYKYVENDQGALASDASSARCFVADFPLTIWQMTRRFGGVDKYYLSFGSPY